MEPKPEPIKIPALGDALAILVDPARRAKEDDRARAVKLFRQIWTADAKGADIAAAGYVFLSKPEGEWKLKAGEPAFTALQEFFSTLGPENLEALPEKETVAALTTLAAKSKEVGGRFLTGPAESLKLFLWAVSSAHIAQRNGTPASELEASLADVGVKKHEFGKLWGTKEGLALNDYRKWVASKDYELGFLEFRSEYKRTRDFSVRYARGLLALFKALERNDKYSRAAVEFELLARSAKGLQRSHVLALAKSIRAKSPCRACAGTHKVNCTACRGKMKVNLECKGCGGSGKINTFRGIAQCRHCKGVGIYRNVKCPKCKATGKTDCKARGCKRPIPAPNFDSFADAYKCALCMGKGTLLKHVSFTCPVCQGIGILLRPSHDPSKMIATRDAR